MTPGKRLQSVAISMPAYNEEYSIEKVVRESIDVLKEITDDYEVVVVNDGSVDNTGPILNKLSQSINNLKVYHHESNKGIGPTLKDVFLKPTKEWVFFIAGDGQVPPVEIHKLVPFADRCDYVIGRRVCRSDPAIRKINAWVYNLIISIIAGKRIRDVDSAVFYRRDVMNNMELNSESAFIHAEIYLNMMKKGIKPIEIGIRHVSREAGRGTGANIRVIYKAGVDIVRYLFRQKKLK